MNRFAPALLGRSRSVEQHLQDGYSIHRAVPTARFGRDGAEAMVSYLRTIQEPRKPK